jgi:hypothetical protein
MGKKSIKKKKKNLKRKKNKIGNILKGKNLKGKEINCLSIGHCSTIR